MYDTHDRSATQPVFGFFSFYRKIGTDFFGIDTMHRKMSQNTRKKSTKDKTFPFRHTTYVYDPKSIFSFFFSTARKCRELKLALVSLYFMFVYNLYLVIDHYCMNQNEKFMLLIFRFQLTPIDSRLWALTPQSVRWSIHFLRYSVRQTNHSHSYARLVHYLFLSSRIYHLSIRRSIAAAMLPNHNAFDTRERRFLSIRFPFWRVEFLLAFIRRHFVRNIFKCCAIQRVYKAKRIFRKR